MKIVYNIYVAVRKLWTAVFGKDGDGKKLAIPGRIKNASGDVTVGSGLELASGDVLNCTVPTPTTVVANPTMTGTEGDLEGLQVGDTKYKVPSGGGTIYIHMVQGYFTANWRFSALFFTGNDTPFTDSTLANYLKENGFTVSADKIYPASGHENKNPIIGINAYITGSTATLMMQEYDIASGNATSSGAGGITITDTIITIG